jgi:hypothetical protein
MGARKYSGRSASAPPAKCSGIEEGKAALTGTLRQRMEQHRADPGIASPARMDPIGFGFENFGAIGAWREKEGDFGSMLPAAVERRSI